MRVVRKDDSLNDAIEVLDAYYERAGHDIEAASALLTSSDNDFINGELDKCMRLPDYFIQNYYLIRTENQDLRALWPYREEQDIIVGTFDEEWERNGCCKVAIVKGRQFGGTTIVQARMFQHTIFHERNYTLIVAQDDGTAKHIIDMSNTAYSFLPWWMKPEQKYKTKAEGITFQREDDDEITLNPGLGSILRISHAQKMSGVAIGRSVSAAHLSELSRWPQSDILETDILPSMRAQNGFYVMESTGQGKDDPFYTFVTDIRHGDIEDWRLLFVPTYKVKRYSLPLKKGETITLTEKQQQFHDNVKKETGFTISPEAWKFRLYGLRRKARIQAFKESYPWTIDEAFQNSGRCAFDLDALEEMKLVAPPAPRWIGEIKLQGKKPVLDGHEVPAGYDKLPVRKSGKGGKRLWIWEHYQPGDNYYVASDAAGGNGGDYSCCQVFRLGVGFDERGRPNKDVQVAEWWGWESPKRFAKIVQAIGYLYGTCEVANEYQGPGITTGDAIVDADYPNLWRPRHKDRTKFTFTPFVHWVTTIKTRDLIISEMQDALLMDNVVINSHDLLEEMGNFATLNEGGRERYEGIDSKDDGVLASTICLYCMRQAFQYEKESPADGQVRPSQVDPNNPNPLWGVIPFEWNGPWVIRNMAMQIVGGKVYHQKAEAESAIEGKAGLRVMPHWSFAAANPWVSPLHQQSPQGYWGSNAQYQAKRVLELSDTQVTPTVLEAFKRWQATVRDAVPVEAGGYQDDW